MIDVKGSGSGVKAVYGVTGNTAEAARETGIELVDQVVNLRFGQLTHFCRSHFSLQKGKKVKSILRSDVNIP